MKLFQNNNGGLPIYHPNFKRNLKTRTHEWETRHDTTGLQVCAEKNFLRFQRNGSETTTVVSPSITQILSEIWKAQLKKWRPDTPGRKVRAENNFLQFRGNSPKTTIVVSPSITPILSEIRKPELSKWRHDTTGLKVHPENDFL